MKGRGIDMGDCIGTGRYETAEIEIISRIRFSKCCIYEITRKAYFAPTALRKKGSNYPFSM